MKTLLLSDGLSYAMLDDIDWLWLCPYSWCLGSYGYPRARVDGRSWDMHLLIGRLRLGIKAPLEVDHEDRNKLNCQRHNLRAATDSQQMANRISTSKGVTKQGGKFIARIGTNGGTYLGSFGSFQAAADAYDRAAKERYGDFAALNSEKQPSS